LDAAEVHYCRALALQEKKPTPDGRDLALSLGELALLKRDFASARNYLRRSQEIKERLDPASHSADGLRTLAPGSRCQANAFGARRVKQQVELSSAGRSLARLDHDGCFENRQGAHQTLRIAGNAPGEVLGLFEEDGQESAGIDDHQRKAPFSS
jgi:hypothetical protein